MQAEIIAKGDMIAIKTPYNTALIDEIKCMPGRQWDAASKCWLVPADQEGNAREIVRKYFPVAGEGNSVQTETKRLRITVSASSRRTYVGRIEIDGQDLVWSDTGSLRMEGPTWKILEASGGFTSGDARHAYEASWDITIQVRKGARIETAGRRVAGVIANVEEL